MSQVVSPATAGRSSGVFDGLAICTVLFFERTPLYTYLVQYILFLLSHAFCFFLIPRGFRSNDKTVGNVCLYVNYYTTDRRSNHCLGGKNNNKKNLLEKMKEMENFASQ